MGDRVQKITVYLIDEQILFRKGMYFILSKEEDIDVIGDGIGYDEAFDYIESHQPNVVIMNVSQDTSGGIQLIRRVSQNIPSVKMIPLMDAEKEEDLFSAMKSGANACITKDIDSNKLLSLVRNTGKGSKPITKELCRPTLAARILAEFESVDDDIKETLIQLTQAEEDILRNISAGEPLEKIAASLGLDEEGMISKLEPILSKLVTNNQQGGSNGVMDHLQKLSELYARKTAQIQNRQTQATETSRQTAIEKKPSIRQDRISVEDEEFPVKGKARSNPEERLVQFLKGRGYEVEESASMMGLSGVVHTLDILATRDDIVVKHVLAIDVFRNNQGKEDTEIEEISNFDAITDDIGIYNKIIIAIPKLSPRAQKVAEAQNIKVLGINDLPF